MRRKTHEEFVLEVYDRPFIATSRYTTCMEKVSLRCTKCGHEWQAIPNNLLSKMSGCPECAHEGKRGSNDVIKNCGSYVILDISTESFPNTSCKLDSQDLHLFKNRIQASKIGYPAVLHNGEYAFIHSVLMPCAEEVDHKNRDRADNRRANLRECTHAENSFNRSLHKNNSSGYSGIYWNENQGKWVAQISVGGVRKHLGCFTDLEDAAKVRKEAELLYYGEFAPVKKLTDKKV